MIGRRFLGLLAAFVLAAAPSAASADLVVSVQPVTVLAGESGFFDVFVTSDAPASTPDVVGGYILSLFQPAPVAGTGAVAGGVIYTGVVANPDVIAGAPAGYMGYIFPGSSPTVDQTNPNFNYFDFPAGISQSISVGEVFGVGRVLFNALTPGVYQVVVNDDPATGQSIFLRPNGTDIDSTSTPGTITVLDPAAIPEPSAAFLLALTGIAGVAVRRMRRKTGETSAAA